MNVSLLCDIPVRGNGGRPLVAASEMALRFGNPPARADNVSVAPLRQKVSRKIIIMKEILV